MKLGIMQPYFFPNLAHFSLIAATDKWVVFDTPQFDRKGWMNRNRILKRNGGWKYVRVPILKASRETSIREIRLDPHVDALSLFLRNLDAYSDRHAPNVAAVQDVIREGFRGLGSSLVELNVNCLSAVCSYIGLKFEYQIFSRMELGVDPASTAGEWAPRISQALGATCYINPIGGRDLFSSGDFLKAGVEVAFLKAVEKSYGQGSSAPFINGLSVVDALMFLSAAEVRELVNCYKLERFTSDQAGTR